MQEPANWCRLLCPTCGRRLADVVLEPATERHGKSIREHLRTIDLRAESPLLRNVDQAELDRAWDAGKRVRGRARTAEAIPYRQVGELGPRSQSRGVVSVGYPAGIWKAGREHPRGGVYFPDDPFLEELQAHRSEAWIFRCDHRSCDQTFRVRDDRLRKRVRDAVAVGEHRVRLG
jgi:hypothetical protein